MVGVAQGLLNPLGSVVIYLFEWEWFFLGTKKDFDDPVGRWSVISGV